MTIDSKQPLAVQWEQLVAADPSSIGGYAGSIHALAVNSSPEQRARLHIKQIFCAGETLSPPMRKAIREAFGVEPRNSYAAHETNLIAADCPHGGGMHVLGGAVLVEVLDGDRVVGEGEQGEAVITALHSYAMPVMRYRLGDLVTRGPAQCSCGAPGGVISEVQGRVIDVFPMPHGGTLHPYSIITPLVHFTKVIRQYQIVQESLDLIRIRLVGLGNATTEERRMIEEALGAVCGPAVTVQLEAVDEIRSEANRKYRPYYSLVKQSAPELRQPE